jgi:hypothetical protein
VSKIVMEFCVVDQKCKKGYLPVINTLECLRTDSSI